MLDELQTCDQTEIVCPFCENRVLGDIDDYSAIDEEYECDACGETYYLTTSTIPIYTTVGYKQCPRCSKKIKKEQVYCEECLSCINNYTKKQG